MLDHHHDLLLATNVVRSIPICAALYKKQVLGAMSTDQMVSPCGDWPMEFVWRLSMGYRQTAHGMRTDGDQG